ncbi:109_t:CDS:2 [Entrophospora sp. SA101]|nr:109_t:CDS:2 [Entrophospora sp. SA101]
MTVYSQLLGETDRRRKTRSCKRSQASIVKNLQSTKMELAQCKDENEDLSQMVINLHRDLETQSKEIESKLQGQMDYLIKKNIDLIEKNNLLNDQLENLEH